MSLNKNYPLYELTPEVFERLCFDLLTRTYQGFDFGIHASVPGRPDKGVDFVATKEETGKHLKIAIEIKHRTSLHPDGLRMALERSSDYFSDFDEVVIITSSPLTDTHRKLVTLPSIKDKGLNVKLIGQSDIFELLDKNKDIAERYFEKVREKVKIRNYLEYTAALGAIISIFGLVFSLYTFNIEKTGASLNNQIDSVEVALKGVRDLEKSLSKLKGDLQDTSSESERIKREYEEALKLKSITSEQLNQIKKAVSAQSKPEIVMNYLLGFLLGLGSSIFGAIIYERIKRFRTLRSE